MLTSDRMSEINRKEMLAGLFLSKFNTRESQAGLKRLGYSKFKEAYEGLAALVGGNPLSVRNYRDEFDPAFDNGRVGYHMREMHPTRREMLKAYGWMGMEEMAALLEDQFLGTEKFAKALEATLTTSSIGSEVAKSAEKTIVEDKAHFISGNIDPTSAEGKERIAQTKRCITQTQFGNGFCPFTGENVVLLGFLCQKSCALAISLDGRKI